MRLILKFAFAGAIFVSNLASAAAYQRADWFFTCPGLSLAPPQAAENGVVLIGEGRHEAVRQDFFETQVAVSGVMCGPKSGATVSEQELIVANLTYGAIGSATPVTIDIRPYVQDRRFNVPVFALPIDLQQQGQAVTIEYQYYNQGRRTFVGELNWTN